MSSIASDRSHSGAAAVKAEMEASLLAQTSMWSIPALEVVLNRVLGKILDRRNRTDDRRKLEDLHRENRNLRFRLFDCFDRCFHILLLGPMAQSGMKRANLDEGCHCTNSAILQMT